eukprot:TRINITY_DN9978_c0_g1_i1.p1 TRINITY_DN9978_c0_g1~~TRINITY_DN9978_c0_g1_i1.p1  ORF type:complete len:412 (-),score=56.11 TRINITY_DN9978_c0_g1_i1:33-1268(-)
MLPLNLSGRQALRMDSLRGAGALPPGTCWLAVLCGSDSLRSSSSGIDGQGGSLTVQVPMNHCPTPYVTRNALVRVLARTPCCGAPIQGLALHVGGTPIGNTLADGSLEVALPPGRHVLSAPDHSEHEVVVEVRAGDTSSREVVLPGGDSLLAYLMDNSYEDDVKDALMLCANRTHPNLPDGRRPFIGTASVGSFGWTPPHTSAGSGASALRAPNPVLLVKPNAGSRCAEVLRALEMRSADGRPFEPNEDFEEWLEQDDCLLSLLFAADGNGSVRVGNLIGRPPRTTSAVAGRAGGGSAQVVASSAAISGADDKGGHGYGSNNVAARPVSAGARGRTSSTDVRGGPRGGFSFALAPRNGRCSGGLVHGHGPSHFHGGGYSYGGGYAGSSMVYNRFPGAAACGMRRSSVGRAR